MKLITTLNSIRKQPSILIEYFYYKFDPIITKKYFWSGNRKSGMKHKKYGSYQEYVSHQGARLKRIFLAEWFKKYDTDYRQYLFDRLNQHHLVKPGKSVLCLAARSGAEVKSFLDIGCFAIGIDLNPGTNNKYVLSGDFHYLQFSDRSTDVIFSNSIDHVFDMKKFVSEITRVLKPTGLLVLELTRGEKDSRGWKPGYYESIYWPKLNGLIKVFTKVGFKKIYQESFTKPWPGEHIVLRYDRKAS